ncbi:hypothetical protein [Pyramidobacter piscolens]|uniref:hypothetical protein n=1 Tax=Pyramidobacter piscolens TaxID=638849 RepID=UPI00249312C7|nr:hypothetical protein [Pyramidobacter piscolens]
MAVKEAATLKRSIMDMAHGAIKERCDVEMGRILNNILDENTNPKTKRKLVLTLEFVPNEQRSMVSVDAVAKATLAPLRSVGTALALGLDKEGTPVAVEAKADLPGQTNLFESENMPVELNVVAAN